MLKKISQEAFALIGTITIIATSVYNTERTIYENRKRYDEKKIENQDLQNQINELRDKLELYRDSYKEAVESNSLDKEDLSPTELNNKVASSLSKVNIDLNNIDKSSLYSNEYFNNDNLLFSFSTSFILLSLITLSSVSGLIFNYYIKLYGDQYIDKVPK
jgi:hypothetical protein